VFGAVLPVWEADMIQLHAHPYSGNSRKVHWALEEMGADYTYQLVDLMSGAHKRPEFVALNPHGRVPVLEDDGFVLYESNAILLHVAACHGKGSYLGRNERERALIHQWLFVQAFDLQPYMQKAFVTKLYASFGQEFDADAHARALRELPPGLGVLDQHLAGKTYVVGEEFTIADIAIGELIGIADFAGCDLAPYSNIRAWFARISERPAFKKTRPKG
jgi:glutathione S-transferase